MLAWRNMTGPLAARDGHVRVKWEIKFWQISLWADFWYYSHPTRHMKSDVFVTYAGPVKIVKPFKRVMTGFEYAQFLHNKYMEFVGMY